MTASRDSRYTDAIAEWVAELRFRAIPTHALDRVKLLMLDSLGCGLYGVALPWSQILLSTLRSVDEGRGASVWGTGIRLSGPHAALANGSFVQSFELDDVHARGVLHVGAVTLPALFAAAEFRGGVSGKSLLAAAIAGYEIGPRVGICMGPEHIGQGWHSGATVGVFSAASASASVLGLSASETVDALGIAGTQSSGLMAAQYGAMVKRMHAGRAAQSGLYGALLAQRGFTGIRNVFESPYGGFCTTFSRSQDRFDLDRLTAGLGTSYETERISLKFYSCVASNHTTLDALQNILARRPFRIDELEEIVVHGSRVTVDHVGWSYVPEGVTGAQLNLPFCVATLLLCGDVFVDQFTASCVDDAERIALASRVTVLEDPAITAKGAGSRHEVRVEVRLKDGTVVTEAVSHARGSEARFATADEVVTKFHKLTCDRYDSGDRDRIVELVLGLEVLDDVGELLEVVGVGPIR